MELDNKMDRVNFVVKSFKKTQSSYEAESTVKMKIGQVHKGVKNQIKIDETARVKKEKIPQEKMMTIIKIIKY